MGTNISKSNNEPAAAQVQKSSTEKDIGGNPDPRSPTPEITRTPLQIKNGGKHNITKNVDLRKTFENGKTDEKLIHNNPILSAVIKNHLQSYDPRSPTQDFERTPIVLSSSADDVGNREQFNDLLGNNCGSPSLNDTLLDQKLNNLVDANEISPELIIPKNLCNGFYDLTINDSLKDSEGEPLGSSTASNEAIEENMSKESLKTVPTILLETNFEYIDDSENLLHQNNEEHLVLSEVNPEYVENKPLFKILKKDPRSPSIDIDRTPIIVSSIDCNSSDENVEQMSDDSLIKVLQNTNTELRLNSVEKKDGILIYEDEAISSNETPQKSKTSNEGSRTPLSCMRNKTDSSQSRSKSVNLKICKDNAISKKVSHIPRLKSLSKQKFFPTGSSISLKSIGKPSVVGGNCENTPPQTHRDIWDKDCSIVL